MNEVVNEGWLWFGNGPSREKSYVPRKKVTFRQGYKFRSVKVLF